MATMVAWPVVFLKAGSLAHPLEGQIRMMTPNAEPAVVALPIRSRRSERKYLCAAAILILISWVMAQYPPTAKVSNILDVSPVANIITAGAIPWFLQWASVCCIAYWLCRRQATNWKSPALFAIWSSFMFAAVWWFGLVFKFWGMDSLDGILESASLDIQSSYGTLPFFDFFIFNFIGPIIGPIGLHGPGTLAGLNFFSTLVSSSLLVGYLLIVGRLCRIGSKNTIKDHFIFLATMIPLFSLPCIRLIMQIQVWLLNYKNN